MRSALHRLAAGLVAAGLAGGALAAGAAPTPGHLRLVDRLDRPQDGYCIDIVGHGPFVRHDLPLTAHNCKPGLHDDEAVVLAGDGTIRFPAYGKCLTATGLASRSLPGTALVARECGESSPFLEAEWLQVLRLDADGRVSLEGADLCLTVGERSDSTFNPDHRWRALFLEDCTRAEPRRSRWQFVVPEVNRPL